MNSKILLCFLLSSGLALDAQERAAVPQVMHLATALDHITAIDLGESITLIAVGSDAFQVERREDKVLIKPLEEGIATDLLIWTPTRRLIYELDPPGEVKHMNFAVDNRIERRTATLAAAAAQEEAGDSLMARAFLAALPIASSDIRDHKNGITVRVEHVLFSKRSVYLHCSIRNLGQGSYRLLSPTAARLIVSHPAVSLVGRGRSQLASSEVGKMRGLKSFPLLPTSVQVSNDRLAPGQTAEVVIALAQPLDAGALLSLTFAPDGTGAVQAFVVL